MSYITITTILQNVGLGGKKEAVAEAQETQSMSGAHHVPAWVVRTLTKDIAVALGLGSIFAGSFKVWHVNVRLVGSKRSLGERGFLWRKCGEGNSATY